VSVAAGTPAGSYTVVYQLCENLNPANCDTASVSVNVTAATVAANDDSGSTSATVATALQPSVIDNDTLGGLPLLPGDADLTQLSSTDPGVVLDTATGLVEVAAGTAAGTYTLVYQVCEALNPANCDTASVTVEVTASTIVANPDTRSVSGSSGGIAGSSVLLNDWLDGAPPTLADVTLSEVSSTFPGVALDSATGRVSVTAGTPAGTYSLVYQFCEIVNPANCASAPVTVIVAADSIQASDDAAAIGGATGGTAVPDVLANDRLNGLPVDPADVTVGQVSTSSANVTLDPATGAVSVSAGTPAGNYAVVYQVCQVLNPAACDTASVTVTVTAAVLAINPDARGVNLGSSGAVPPSVLDNDTLDGAPVDPADVTLGQVSTTSPDVFLDTASGEVVVSPGTTAGSYTVVYQACETLNPANCATASVTVTVTSLALVAAPDQRSIDGVLGGTAPPSVLGNDTLNGVPVDPADVTLAEVSTTHPGLSLDTATGQVTVAPGTPAGGYALVYEVCEVLDPGSCAQATVSVTVTAGELIASDDSGSVGGATGGTAGVSVLENDRLGGAPVDPANVTLRQVSSTDPGVSLDVARGTVVVAPDTPLGTYTVVYEVCERLNPGNCDSAIASVTVTEATVVASPDARSIGGRSGGSAVPSVIANDTVNGAPADLARVSLALVSSTSPSLSLDLGSGMVDVLPGTPAGSYTLVYEICETLNPANCGQGTVTLAVTAAVIIANADSGSRSGLSGGTAIPSVLENDTLDGEPMAAVEVILSQLSTSDPGVALDTATGAVLVTAGTPAGPYALAYQVCERLNSGNCASATVQVTVTAATVTAQADEGSLADGGSGGIAIASVLANDTLGGAPADLADVTLRQVSAAGPYVALDTDSGGVFVAPGTPSGAYPLVYEVCEKLNPANCATATATVTVTAADIVPVAVGDAFVAGEGEPLSGDLSANDIPGNLSSRYSLAPGGGPANGDVVIDPAGTFEYVPDPGFVGSDTFVYEVCDADGDCATGTVSISVAPQPGKLRVQKAASQAVAGAASLVAFTITLTNVSGLPVRAAELVDQTPRGLSLVPGSVRIADEDGAGTVEGSGPFTVTGIDLPADGTATVRYLMRVSAGAPEGEYVNVATAEQLGIAISNTASAKLRVSFGSDPDTEQARVLGKVFDDQDGDGWQDEGERGIPGVRIASVEGLVAETDVYGRYHFEGLTLSNAARGQNVVLKVDRATLPDGSAFTTPNPLLRRVTPGLPVRFDFGVRLPRQSSVATGPGRPEAAP
jgi:uncharacterized repeat protein (TIGR01451 family)